MKVLNIHKLGGKLSPNSVYIGNKNLQYELEKSKWANPYYLENWSRSKKIAEFEKYFVRCIEDGTISKEDLISLYGKDLVCFCYPKDCHGNVIRKYVVQAYFNSLNQSHEVI